ncbi:hypothetical protein BGZ98_002540 [Dissophora globulifera]|nr:hypothetical protein BGZ98_002540 [Dissophora globulifera]
MLVSGDATSSSNGSNSNNGNNTADKQPQRITQMDADQKTLFYFAIFDGHGGSHTADFLMAHLDEHIEQATPDMVPQVIRDLRKLGGYFRSFRPLFLEPFLPADFEDRYGSGKLLAEERARQRRKINVKGKGGQVKPMIFIPHPNATEEDQKQEVESLEHAAMGSSGKQGAQPSEHRGTPLNKDSQATAAATTATVADTKRMEKNKRDTEDDDHEDFYDADEDPFVMARRRHLNKTSPLPGGTTAYFGTDQSEYARLVVKHKDPETVKTETPQPEIPIPTTMTLEQRLCLSFLQCDTELIRNKYKDGSTASVVIVQSKGAFWETPDDLDLLIAHVGDTRILLCEAPRGESIQLTTDHHPDAIVESERIRKMAAYVTADSFGENMFLGQVANTRALGDIATKPYGVSAEPELVRRTVKASEAAFLVLISDGISSVMSNQEVVDCVKLEDDPTQAAANVLNLAEQLGAEDNCTVLVVKLPAWGKKMPDLSKELREYRRQMEMQNSRARRQ